MLLSVLMWHPCKFEGLTPFKGRRATIKAHPATPHHSRPYRKNEELIRICLIIGYLGFSIIVVWVAALMCSLYMISTAIGSDVRDQSTRSSLLRGTYFSKTILRASVSSSVLVTRRAVPENMVLLYQYERYKLQPCGVTRDTTSRL